MSHRRAASEAVPTPVAFPGTTPTSSSSSTVGGSREGRSRMKMLLREYLAPTDDEDHQNPRDINSFVFEAEPFFAETIRKNNLAQLEKLNSTLMKETKELDSRMKTLVYENYNKFISATDTIRQMKHNVVNMEEEMQHLSESMKQITSLSSNINTSLGPNREMIEKLSGVAALLNKRQFLFELPNRLNKCIELKAFTQAVKYYAGSRYILDKYKHLPSFNSINTETETIIERLKGILRTNICNDSSSIEDMTENVGLLIELKDDVETLCSQFLNWRTQLFSQELEFFSTAESLKQFVVQERQADKKKKAKQAADQPPSPSSTSSSSSNDPPGSEEPTATEITFFLQKFTQYFLREVFTFCTSYHNMFLQRENPEDVAKKISQQLSTFIRQVFGFYTDRVGFHIKGLKAADAIRIIDRLRLVLSEPGIDIPEDLARLISASLNVSNFIYSLVLAFIHSLYQTSHTHLLQTLKFLEDSFRSSSSEAEVSARAQSGLQSVTVMGANGVRSELSFDLSAPDQAADLVARSIISDHLGQFLSAVIPFFQLKSPQHFLAKLCSKFMGSVVSHISNLLLTVQTSSEAFEEQLASQVPLVLAKKLRKDQILNPVLLLIYSRICLKLQSANDGMNEIKSRLTNIIHLYDPSQQVDLSDDLSVIQQALLSSSNRLIGSYIRDKGTSLSTLIRKSIDTPDWLHMKEPTERRGVIKMVTEDVQGISQELTKIIGVQFGGNGANVGSARSMARANRFMEAAKSSSSPNKIEFTAPSIVGAIIFIFAKTFCECVRLKTFNKFGFQQIQVDVHFLKTDLRNYFITNASVDQILDEVVSSAMNRSTDPSPMEKNIIHSIYSRSKENEKPKSDPHSHSAL